MDIVFGRKFTSIHVDAIIQTYWSDTIKSTHPIVFDLQATEWIALEELVLFFGWVRHLTSLGKQVLIKLPRVDQNNQRLEECFRSLWMRWEIFKVVPVSKPDSFSRLEDLFDLSNPSTAKFINEIYRGHANYSQFTETNNEGDDQHSILPFSSIPIGESDVIDDEGFEDRDIIREETERIFTLSEDVEGFLKTHTSFGPFENRTLSNVVTVELLLNAFHHAFHHDNISKECYLAIALRQGIDRQNYITNQLRKHGRVVNEKQADIEINRILQRNYDSERAAEERPFFREQSKNSERNVSFVEFTYIDFGQGIPKTLLPRASEVSNIASVNIDTRLLQFAFELESSKFPYEDDLKIKHFIPRGLYFLKDIVRQHRGLLIARSNKGKVVFDFSKQEVRQETRYSANDEKLPNFAGTMISIVLPAIKERSLPIRPTNKPSITFEGTAGNSRSVVINVTAEYEQAKKSTLTSTPERLIDYQSLLFQLKLKRLLRKLQDTIVDCQNYKTIIYFDFAGFHNHSIIRKVLFFICNSPYINDRVAAIVVNANFKEDLRIIQETMIHDPVFLYHPVPCYVSDREIIWLGIKDLRDEARLNDLIKGASQDISTKEFAFDPRLYQGYLVKIGWVEEPSRGNVTIELPTDPQHHNDYIFNSLPEDQLKGIVFSTGTNQGENENSILLKSKNNIYFTAGGYYQEEFVDLFQYLYSENNSRRIASYLVNKFSHVKRLSLSSIDYVVTVTLSSQILGKAIIDEWRKLNSKEGSRSPSPKLIRLANYHNFLREPAFKGIEEDGKRILIVSDVIATGNLTNRLFDAFARKKHAIVEGILTIIDTRVIEAQADNEIAVLNNKEIDERIISLMRYPIKKYKNSPDDSREIVTINPILNSPNDNSIVEGETKRTLLPFGIDKSQSVSSDRTTSFLDLAKPEHLWFGHIEHNSVHHSYYIRTQSFFETQDFVDLFQSMIKRIQEIEGVRQDGKKFDIVFYPLFTGIEGFGKAKLRSAIQNRGAQVFGFPRVYTDHGWRFPFPPTFLRRLVKGKNALLVDDGTWTGDSLIQLIDSACLFDIGSLTFLSIMGRVEDYNREFFTKIRQMEASGVNLPSSESRNLSTPSPIPINIYFGTQLHISTYQPFPPSCPLCQDLGDLIQIKKDANTPGCVLEYAEDVLKDLKIIEPHSEIYHGIPDRFRFLLPDKENGNNVNDLFHLRDKIGRIDSYRLFKEYINVTWGNDQRELELCMVVILHEPRLLRTISNLMPSLVEKLRRYISSLVLNQGGEYPHTIFNWPKDELVRFLFLINPSTVLGDKELFVLINNVGDDAKALNCISFEIWRAFSGTSNEPNQSEQIVSSCANLWRRINMDLPKPHPFHSHLRQLLVAFPEKQYRDGTSVDSAYALLRIFYLKEAAGNSAHTKIGQLLHNVIIPLWHQPVQSALLQERFNEFKITFQKYLTIIRKVADYQSQVSHPKYVNVFLHDGKPVWKVLEEIETDVLTFEDSAQAKAVRDKLHLIESHLYERSSRVASYFTEFGCNLEEIWREVLLERVSRDDHEQSHIVNLDQSEKDEPAYSALIHPDILRACYEEIIKNAEKNAEGKPINWTYVYKQDEYQATIEIVQFSRNIKIKSSGLGIQSITKWIKDFRGHIDFIPSESSYRIIIRGHLKNALGAKSRCSRGE